MSCKKHTSTIIVLSLMLSALILFQKLSPADSSEVAARGAVIKGRVVSRYGPVENARVRVPGEESFTVTDKDGRFALKTSHPPGESLRITAGKEGWFNNEQFSQPSGSTRDIFLNPVYLNDRLDYQFNSPRVCVQCHVKLSQIWNKSKMAHTTSNPKVLDMFYGTDALRHEGIGPGYRLDNPKSNGNCLTCHAPSVAASVPWSQDFITALRSPGTEWDGVSCDYCHKVRNVIKDTSKPSGMSAVLERQSSSRGPSILVFGPYDDVVVPPMAASYNPVFDKGEFCSLCHGHFKELGTESAWDPGRIYTESERNGFGLKDNTLLPIQTTYQEWKQWQDSLSSDDPNKGKKCQDCHMSWRKEMLPYDNYVVEGMARNMWATYRSPRDIHPHHFDGGTETQLKTALAMEIEGDVKDKRLIVNLTITNTNGGHWVPTGETMRSVMLVVHAADSNGRQLKMIKGGTLPDWTGVGDVAEGNYSGQPGAVFARVLQDEKGNLNVPFWRATGIASDTRIRPKKSLALEFEFAIADPDDEPTVEAKLVYRPVIRPWAKQKSWDVSDILITSKVW